MDAAWTRDPSLLEELSVGAVSAPLPLPLLFLGRCLAFFFDDGMAGWVASETDPFWEDSFIRWTGALSVGEPVGVRVRVRARIRSIAAERVIWSTNWSGQQDSLTSVKGVR